MPYTWEEVMLGIDVKNEQARKIEQQRLAEEEAAKESSAAGWWSLGLSILGGAIFGPAGYAAGKQLGKIGADIAYDWESMEMEEGKFNKEEAKEFNRALKKAAEDQTSGQIVDAVMDLGKMYVMSGGLTAGPGEWDPTTFGSGGAEGGEWSLRGKGTAPIDTSNMTELELTEFYKAHPDITGMDFKTGIMPGSEDYVPSLWSQEQGLFGNLREISERGSSLISQDTAVQTAPDLYRLIASHQGASK